MKGPNRMKPILIVIDNFQIGGAEKQAFYLAKALKSNFQYDVKIAALYKLKNEPLIDKLKEEGIAYGYYHALYLKYSRLKWLTKIVDAIVFFKYNNYYIISYTIRPNVFCGQMWRLGIGKKFIWNQEDVAIGFPGPGKGKLYRKILENASVIISNSQIAADHLASFAPSIKTKINVVKNGVFIPIKKYEKDYKSKLRHKLNLPRDGRIIIKVANITGFKDHKTVIDAAAKLKEIRTHKVPWHFLFVGYLGNKYEELSQMIIMNDLTEKIIFTGFQHNVNEYIRAADIAIFSSWSEGIPNGILEPMANGLPVIASKIPGNIEALGVGYPYYFEPGDSEKLKELLYLFLDNQDLIKEVGEDCYKSVCQNFSMTKMINATLSIIS